MKPTSFHKKWLLSLSLITLALLLFAAAISTQNTNLPTIYIVLQKTAENCQDFYLVEEELNQYLADTQDFQVQFKLMDETSVSQEYLNLLKSNEPIDLLFSDRSNMVEAVSQNLLEPLDVLLDTFGDNISPILNKDYLNTGFVGNIPYGLPSIRDYSCSACFEYNVSIAQKYGLQMESVKDLDDLEIQLQKLKKADASIVPVGINLYIAADALLQIDCLSDDFLTPLAVLQNYGQDTQVVNLYETEEFADFSKRMYRWRREGLLMEESGASISAINYLKSGKVLGCFSHYHPGFDVEESRGSGEEIGCIILGDPYITSFNADRHFWEIPSKSQSKETAMRFLDLMYSDQNIIQILSYGKEGVHYEYKDDEKETIGYPDGLNVNNSRYSQFLGWMYGNEMLLPVWEGMPENLWAQIEDYNDSSIRSVGIGFCFDTQPVEKELTQCVSIVNKYYNGLLTGELDPEKYLPLMTEQLHAAGVNSILSEKQKQLDHYISQKENLS